MVKTPIIGPVSEDEASSSSEEDPNSNPSLPKTEIEIFQQISSNTWAFVKRGPWAESIFSPFRPGRGFLEA